MQSEGDFYDGYHSQHPHRPVRLAVEVYHLVDGHYQLLAANERGHYSIVPLGVELGIWQGRYTNFELPWLRWWDSQGNLLLSGEERAEQERQRAEEAESLLEQERLRTEQLAVRLRELGIDLEE